MIKCKVIAKESKVLSRSNGGEYVLHNCEILDGAHKGAVIAVQRTLLNAENAELKANKQAYETKEPFEVGQEIVAYPSTVQDAEGNFATFFEGSSGAMAASPAQAYDIAAAYATPDAAKSEPTVSKATITA